MEGWSRDDVLRRRPACRWVMPSPNIPTLDTAIVYPGTVLFEGTHASRRGAGRRGRSSWSARRGLHAERFAAGLNARGLRGRVLPAGRVRADVSEARRNDVRRLPDPRDRPRARSARCAAAAALLLECFRANPAQFEWRLPPYEYETTKMPIDILAGSPALRQQIEGQLAARGHRRELAGGCRGVPRDQRGVPALPRVVARGLAEPRGHGLWLLGTRARRIWSAWLCAWAA